MPNYNLEKTHLVELWNADLDLLFEFCLLHVTDYFEVIAEIWQFVRCTKFFISQVKLRHQIFAGEGISKLWGREAFYFNLYDNIVRKGIRP